jgi:hypothetical protein
MDSRSTFLRHMLDRWRDGVWKVRGRIEMSLAGVEGSCRQIRSDIPNHRTKTLMFR